MSVHQPAWISIFHCPISVKHTCRYNRITQVVENNFYTTRNICLNPHQASWLASCTQICRLCPVPIFHSMTKQKFRPKNEENWNFNNCPLNSMLSIIMILLLLLTQPNIGICIYFLLWRYSMRIFFYLLVQILIEWLNDMLYGSIVNNELRSHPIFLHVT